MIIGFLKKMAYEDKDPVILQEFHGICKSLEINCPSGCADDNKENTLERAIL
jgi:hypothetical protein